MAYVEVVFRTDCPVSTDAASRYLGWIDGATFVAGHHRLLHRISVIHWDDAVELVGDLYEDPTTVYLVVGGPAHRAYNSGAARKARMLEFWDSIRPSERALGYLCLGLSGTKYGFEETLKAAPGWVRGAAAAPARNSARRGLQSLKTSIAGWMLEE